MSRENEKSEMSLQEISEFLDVKDENSLIRKKIEKYDRQIQELFKKTDELEIQMEKKKEEYEIGRDFAKSKENEIKNMTQQEKEELNVRLKETLRANLEFQRLVLEYTSDVIKISKLSLKLKELKNKFNL